MSTNIFLEICTLINEFNMVRNDGSNRWGLSCHLQLNLKNIIHKGNKEGLKVNIITMKKKNKDMHLDVVKNEQTVNLMFFGLLLLLLLIYSCLPKARIFAKTLKHFLQLQQCWFKHSSIISGYLSIMTVTKCCRKSLTDGFPKLTIRTQNFGHKHFLSFT